MAKSKKVSWNFPLKKVLFLKIEVLFVALLAVFVFFFAFNELGRRWLPSTVLTLAFLGIHFFISFLVQKLRAVEENYHLTPTYLHITRKSKHKSKKEKISLKSISHHKLDKFFLGGYLLTIKGKKHLLFFNTRKEVEKFESFIKKHLKPLKNKSKK